MTDTEQEIPTCNFCKGEFRTRSGLFQHQRTVAYCVSEQERLGIVIKRKKDHSCENCNKKFTANSSLKYHLNICKKKLVKDIEDEKNALLVKVNEHDKELKELYKKVEELQSKGNTTHHNTTNNNTTNNNTTNHNNITIQNWMTEERVMEIFRKYSKGVDDLSPKKLAAFTANHLVNGVDRPMYLCTDPSRQRMVYFDESGNKHVDNNCSMLIKHIMQAKPFVDQVVQDYITYETQEEIERVKPFHSTFYNLHQSRNYKMELSRQLPQTEEIALIQPSSKLVIEESGVDWDINEKIREKEEAENRVEVSDRCDNPDFFYQEDPDDF